MERVRDKSQAEAAMAEETLGQLQQRVWEAVRGVEEGSRKLNAAVLSQQIAEARYAQRYTAYQCFNVNGMICCIYG